MPAPSRSVALRDPRLPRVVDVTYTSRCDSGSAIELSWLIELGVDLSLREKRITSPIILRGIVKMLQIHDLALVFSIMKVPMTTAITHRIYSIP